jgi:hypothetical protein
MDEILQTILAFYLVAGFAFMLVMIPVWFVVVSKFFTFLASEFPQEYKEMGSPTLLMNNSIGNNISFLNYIRSSRPKEIGDLVLIKKSQLLKRMFNAYLFTFISCIVGVCILTNS